MMILDWFILVIVLTIIDIIVFVLRPYEDMLIIPIVITVIINTIFVVIWNIARMEVLL